MGLLYPFPVSEEEKDHVIKASDSLTLKSYGLPYIFWIYLLCILAVIFFLFLAVKNPLGQIYAGDDQINKYIATALIVLLIAVPLVLVSFFFYEKRLIKKQSQLIVEHRFFGIKLRSLIFELTSESKLEIRHHLDSPNIASLRDEETLKAFKNRGYHELFLTTNKGNFFIDRHSQLSELKKLQLLLESKN